MASPITRPVTCPVLIGRAPYLRAVVAALDSAQRGAGRTMLVSGEAGIGKSRLLAEVASQAARRGLACLLGNAYEADSDVPFAPLTDLLRGVVAAVTAELTIVDRDRPPSKPTILAGKPAIAEYYHDVCGRAMTHTVEQALAGSDGIAFTEACRYPDGMRVLSANLLALRGGKIARHTLVQAWDA